MSAPKIPEGDSFALWVGTMGKWAISPLIVHKSYDLISSGIGKANWFDHVNVRGDMCALFGQTIDFWVDDEGLLKELPVNLVAAILDGRPLVGPIVITGGCDPEGATLGLKRATAEKLIRGFGLREQDRLAEWPDGGEEEARYAV